MARNRAEEIKRVAAPGCRLPAPIPPGQILTDVRQNKWILGEPIGWGGFGDIYLASDNIAKPVDKNAKFIIKIEPHDNGPLFVEMNFYIRAAQKSTITSWCKSRGLRNIGVPTYEGSGSLYYQGERYRFLVIPRYGVDVGKLFQSHNRKFSEKTVNNLAIQILDALEYIHSRGYAHADIKGCNILLDKNISGIAAIEKSRAYLVDYGLALRFRTSNGCHKPFVHDERRAHEGTLEYTSRDAHHGTHSRRGDLETLGYNLIQWMSGKLPWENKEGGVSSSADPEVIQQQKEQSLSNIPNFLHKCFPNKRSPSSIADYMNYVVGLEFESKPDYSYLRSLFGQSFNVERNVFKYLDRQVSNENLCPMNRPRRENLRVRKPCRPLNREVRITRNMNNSSESEPFKWEEVLATHPEKLAKAILQPIEEPLTPPPSPPPPATYPTYAMLIRMQKIKDHDSGNKQKLLKLLNNVQAKWLNPPLESAAQLKKKHVKQNHSDTSDEEAVIQKTRKRKRKSHDNNTENYTSKLRRRYDD